MGNSLLIKPISSFNNLDDFLKSYEEWADKYVEFIKEYKQNATDSKYILEYEIRVSELVEWVEKTDKMESKIKNSKDLLKYSAEISRIAEKISKISE